MQFFRIIFGSGFKSVYTNWKSRSEMESRDSLGKYRGRNICQGNSTIVHQINEINKILALREGKTYPYITDESMAMYMSKIPKSTQCDIVGDFDKKNVSNAHISCTENDFDQREKNLGTETRPSDWSPSESDSLTISMNGVFHPPSGPNEGFVRTEKSQIKSSKPSESALTQHDTLSYKSIGPKNPSSVFHNSGQVIECLLQNSDNLPISADSLVPRSSIYHPRYCRYRDHLLEPTGVAIGAQPHFENDRTPAHSSHNEQGNPPQPTKAPKRSISGPASGPKSTTGMRPSRIHQLTAHIAQRSASLLCVAPVAAASHRSSRPKARQAGHTDRQLAGGSDHSERARPSDSDDRPSPHIQHLPPPGPSLSRQLQEIALVEASSAVGSQHGAGARGGGGGGGTVSECGVDNRGGDSVDGSRRRIEDGTTDQAQSSPSTGGGVDGPRGGFGWGRMLRVRFSGSTLACGSQAEHPGGAAAGPLAQMRGRSFAWASSWVERLPKGGQKRRSVGAAGGGGCLAAVACAVRRGFLGPGGPNGIDPKENSFAGPTGKGAQAVSA